MTMSERAANYARVFPKRPPLQVVNEAGRQVLYGVFVIGADYRNRSTFYGAYPHGYLPRVLALFPDVPEFDEARGKLNHLHVFSGSLPEGMYVRCDLRQEAEIRGSVYDLDPGRDGAYPLILADPPYSAADAVKYETPMVDRRRAMAALARVAEPGAHLVWLDQVWPMHSKQQWVTVGRILLQRSTNHRVRLCSIFQRVAA